MKYYSRSPEDLRQRNDNQGEKEFRKRKVGFIILIVDIAVILLVFLYMTNSRKSDPAVSNMTVSKEFNWQGHEIITECQPVKKCKVTTETNAGIKNQVFRFKWQVFSESKEVFSIGKKLKPEFNSVELPDYHDKQVWLTILDDHDVELIRFRAYP